jgi:DNA-binding transcriptional ArsR family regulator
MSPKPATHTTPVEWVDDADRAAALLHPLRHRLLRLAAVPLSASEMADRLGLPRQRVNYHVHQLAEAGFLKRAGTRRKRNLIEQLYVASAGGYLLGPGVLGTAAADAESVPPSSASAYLLAVAARTQHEVARATAVAAERSVELPALTISAAIRFESAGQRAAFLDALARALSDVVRAHASPDRAADGSPGPGRRHRVVAFCHPAFEEHAGSDGEGDGDGDGDDDDNGISDGAD